MTITMTLDEFYEQDKTPVQMLDSLRGNAYYARFAEIYPCLHDVFWARIEPTERSYCDLIDACDSFGLPFKPSVLELENRKLLPEGCYMCWQAAGLYVREVLEQLRDAQEANRGSAEKPAHAPACNPSERLLPSDLHAGMRVRHSVYGAGVVLCVQTRFQGHPAAVQFCERGIETIYAEDAFLYPREAAD